MGMPSGKIIARVMLPRSCGCLHEFQHYEADKYRAQRQAKFQQSRCPACVAQLEAEQRRAAGVPKGEALKLLPPGTQVSLTLQADGSWAGALAVGGKAVKAAGVPGAGPQTVIVALARLWIVTPGAERQPDQSTA